MFDFSFIDFLSMLIDIFTGSSKILMIPFCDDEAIIAIKRMSTGGRRERKNDGENVIEF